MKQRARVLVTAGATNIPIDQVRVISNIFQGRTGTNIALHLLECGAEVTLITSNPRLVGEKKSKRLEVWPYRTFEDLASQMKKQIVHNDFDIIIHSAAVSDYRVAGVCVLDVGGQLVSIDASKKVSSSHQELYLKLLPTEKLINLVRYPWRFTGKLVKFKLEVGKTDKKLIEIARESCAASQADMIVANCLEWSKHYAYVIDAAGIPAKVSREDLPRELAKRLL